MKLGLFMPLLFIACVEGSENDGCPPCPEQSVRDGRYENVSFQDHGPNSGTRVTSIDVQGETVTMTYFGADGSVRVGVFRKRN